MPYLSDHGIDENTKYYVIINLRKMKTWLRWENETLIILPKIKIIYT